MKKILLFLFIIFTSITAHANETRAVWLTTIGGIDWPHSHGSYTQKEEFISILDQLSQAGINTVLLQTRVRATTIFPSDMDNEKMSFEEQVNEQIETNKKNINWKDLPGAAKEIYNHLTEDAKQESYALERIKNILEEKKSKGEEEAAMKLLNKHKENINIETLTTFVSSDENIYQNTSGEIIDILLNECIHHLSAGEENQLKGIKIKLLEKEEEQKKKKRLKEIKDKAKEAQGKIVDEPEEGKPDVTTICFRYPDGEKTKNRRFLKSNKIQNLYDYIASLGEEIYSEEENSKFSLYQPFPPKKYEQMENTLEEEGLCPNAVVQIREE